VYYSLACPPGSPYEEQLLLSVRTLRRHSPSVPAVVFLYGGSRRSFLGALRAQRVRTRQRGDYAALLRRLCPRTWRPLALYPVLHKWLSLAALPRARLSQVLYADCDTFFAGDVAALFDGYAVQDWYAREEPCTARSPWGRKRGYFDEGAFQGLAAGEGSVPVPPYNLGVCLMNNRVWRRIAERQGLFLKLVWRLLAGLVGSPRHATRLDPGLREALAESLTARDRRTALPYPSSNVWIVEQVAMGLVLGTIPRFSHGLFSWRDVLQGEEFESYTPAAAGTVCHYFSKHQERLEAWLAR
jgi:hypothetical protein